jgi:hypothetical protein
MLQAEPAHEVVDGRVVGVAPERLEQRDLDLRVADPNRHPLRLLLEVLEQERDELRIPDMYPQNPS